MHVNALCYNGAYHIFFFYHYNTTDGGCKNESRRIAVGPPDHRRFLYGARGAERDYCVGDGVKIVFRFIWCGNDNSRVSADLRVREKFIVSVRYGHSDRGKNLRADETEYAAMFV